MGQAHVKDIGLCTSTYVRELEFREAGDCHDWERHYFDHVSLVTAGSVRVEWQQPDGSMRTTEHSKDVFAAIHVPANERHRIVALEPFTRSWCLFVLRDADGNIVLDREKADPDGRYMSGVQE